MYFSQKLQEYRKKEKLSQEELAHHLGVSRQSVSKWEQGLSFPETEKLIELSSLMGVSVDFLLKEDSLPAAEAQVANTSLKGWKAHLPVILLIVVMVVIAAVTVSLKLWSHTLAEHEPEHNPAENTEVPVDEPEDVQAVAEYGFENKHLHDLQSWFFDFAREYRLDYMPYFTQSEGAPTDSGEYLYWAYAINMDHWGDNVGIMTKDYVEETVQQYFGIVPGQHRSHRKSWDFNTETETYVAWPESLREKPYYLLNSIEVDGDIYTVHATCYSSDFLPTEEDDTNLKTKLLDGANTELSPTSEITVSFYISYFTFHRPVFVSFEENFLFEMDISVE